MTDLLFIIFLLNMVQYKAGNVTNMTDFKLAMRIVPWTTMHLFRCIKWCPCARGLQAFMRVPVYTKVKLRTVIDAYGYLYAASCLALWEKC